MTLTSFSIQNKGIQHPEPACSLIPQTWRSPVEQEYFTVSRKITHRRSKRQKTLLQSQHTTYVLLMFAISLDQRSELKAASLTPKFLITQRKLKPSCVCCPLAPDRPVIVCVCVGVTEGRQGERGERTSFNWRTHQATSLETSSSVLQPSLAFDLPAMR